MSARKNWVSKYCTLGVAVVVWLLWFLGMQLGDRWSLLAENWFMSITMAFGSFIAGATSEGGGAVAFPVMTLAFKISPPVARDFSLMIQTVGMNAAALTIILKGIPIERRAVLWSGLGGTVGIYIGLSKIAGLIPPPIVKIFFLSVWVSFAGALYLINRTRTKMVDRIRDFSPASAASLFVLGILGGTISALTGSGLDILIFSLLVLYFRVNERIATPTSVVLMGNNALVGVVVKSFFGGMSLSSEAWGYWWACVPIVVVGAPVGALFIANRSRQFIVGLLYASITIQYVAGLIIIPQTAGRVLMSVITIAVGLGLFSLMARYGYVPSSAPTSGIVPTEVVD